MPVTDRGRRRREAVLDAAESLFLEHGFLAVSVDDLGAAAGISGPGLYRHFTSKDAILMAVLDRIWTRLAPAVTAAETAAAETAAAETTAAETALTGLLDAHLDLAIERPAALELLFRELERLDVDYRARARRNHQRYVAAWSGAIRALAPAQDEATARVVALTVHGVLDSTTRHAAVGATELPADRRRVLLRAAAIAVLAAAGAAAISTSRDAGVGTGGTSQDTGVGTGGTSPEAGSAPGGIVAVASGPAPVPPGTRRAPLGSV